MEGFWIDLFLSTALYFLSSNDVGMGEGAGVLLQNLMLN